jgi:hypothetical protein
MEWPAEFEVGSLWARLGRENRKFLYETAVAFEPGDPFTLDELARDLRRPRLRFARGS